MNRHTAMRIRTIVFFLALLICMTASAALAINATSVSIDGATLTALHPYWKSGGGESAANWDLHFDTTTATPTLRMKNAVLGTLNASNYVVLANGDIIVELFGVNSLSYNGSVSGFPIGLGSYGSILIRDGTGTGLGSLTITIDHSHLSTTFFTCGILNFASGIVIDSGIVNIDLVDSNRAIGIHAVDGLYVRGGATTIGATSKDTFGIETDRFQLSGGIVSATINGFGTDVNAILFDDFLVTGGFGAFTTVENGIGGLWEDPTAGSFRVVGGHVIFSAGDTALQFYTNSTLTPYVYGKTYVSDYPSGFDKVLWDDAMGPLAGNFIDPFAFPYVEMIGYELTALPETGDVSNPWLWVGVGLGALLVSGAAILLFRKKK
jgi:LPXTG-motif cell wall-anchored protein